MSDWPNCRSKKNGTGNINWNWKSYHAITDGRTSKPIRRSQRLMSMSDCPNCETWHTVHTIYRFWLGRCILSHAFGWEGLYPELDEDSTDEEWINTTEKMFEESFLLSILTCYGIFTTEWYLSAEGGEWLKHQPTTETTVNRSMWREMDLAANGSESAEEIATTKIMIFIPRPMNQFHQTSQSHA